MAALLAGGATIREDAGLGARAVAGSEWIEVARANFDDVPDGPGDGKSLPAAIGKLTPLAPSGKTLKDVAPAAGVLGGRLLLSDAGSSGLNDFGFELTPSSDAASAALISFSLSQKCEGNRFGIDVTDDAPTECRSSGGVDDGATTECSASGGVDDGATTELMSIEVEGGNLRVNGHLLRMHLAKATQFRVEFGLFDAVTGDDFFEFAITNVDTGEVETWSDVLAGGYRPVRAVDFVKHAGHAGEVTFDNLSILAPGK